MIRFDVATATPGAVPTADRLEQIAVEIETVQGLALLKIGERLCEAQELFRYDRDEGGFTGWIEDRLRFGSSTAYKLIDVFRAFGDESFHKVETLPKSVLYALAAPSTPPEVRAEAVEMVAAGKKVDTKTVAELKEKLKAAKEDAKAARADKDAREAYVNTQMAEAKAARDELTFAKDRLREKDEEIARLKEPGVIHVDPAPAVAPVAEDARQPSLMRTAGEMVAERFDRDVGELVAILREIGLHGFAAEIEAACQSEGR